MSLLNTNCDIHRIVLSANRFDRLCQRIHKSGETLIDHPFNTIIVDKKHSLVIGINDDSKLTVEEAIGQAIYSTNKRAVEDSIFRFNIILRDFEDESESIKRWLADAVKIADECRHEMN